MNRPAILYKYRSLSPDAGRENTLRILTHSEIYFAAPREFNDPLECQAEIFLKEKMVGLKDHNDPVLIEESRKSMREDLRILSLTAVKDDILMWSHYADCHRGVCFGFNAATDDEWFGLAEPVTYRDDFPLAEATLHGDGRSIFQAFALSKSSYWAYEEEWRIANYQPEQVRQFPSDQLVEVIFGCDISNNDRMEVMTRLLQRRPSVQLYQAHRYPTAYELNIEFLSSATISRLEDDPGVLDLTRLDDLLDELPVDQDTPWKDGD